MSDEYIETFYVEFDIDNDASCNYLALNHSGRVMGTCVEDIDEATEFLDTEQAKKCADQYQWLFKADDTFPNYRIITKRVVKQFEYDDGDWVKYVSEADKLAEAKNRSFPIAWHS
jgi:hypothetical protein